MKRALHVLLPLATGASLLIMVAVTPLLAQHGAYGWDKDKQFTIASTSSQIVTSPTAALQPPPRASNWDTVLRADDLTGEP